MARFCPEFRDELIDQDLVDLPGEKVEQLERLVLEPANQVKMSSGRIVIVLDALDECGGPSAVRELVGLVQNLYKHPARFFIFISCRDVASVNEFFTGVSGADKKLYELDKIKQGEDLEIYVQDRLSNFSASGAWPPTKKQIGTFTRSCDNLFEIAAIRLRDVCDPDSKLPAIDTFERYLGNPGDRPPALDDEYKCIIESAYIDDLISQKRNREGVQYQTFLDAYDRYRLCVCMLITAFRPLILPELASLVQLREDQVQSALKPLRPVLVIGDKWTPFRFYHASCREFLLGDDPCKQEDDPIRKEFPICFSGPRHVEIFEQCLNTRSFGYGRNWKWHLEEIPDDEVVLDIVKSHLEKNFIQWPEHGECGVIC